MTRPQRNTNGSALQRPTTKSSLMQMDEQVLGQISAADANMRNVYPIDILKVWPDATQPRRVIPSVVREQWNGHPANTPELFDAWIDLAAQEMGAQFAGLKAVIRELLRGVQQLPDEVFLNPPSQERARGVLENSLMAVIELAASIYRDGLTNPITVAEVAPSAYQIETGERRWLAFHLLAIFEDDKRFGTIPADIVDAVDVWKQATENNVRVELNAIGKARQLALLIMDLYRQQGVTWMGYGDFQHDRHFYAQVADGQQWRIPRGEGEKLSNAMGVKSPDMLRKYRDLLRLPDAVWTMADDLNWAEQFIREQIMQGSVNERHMIAKATLKAQESGYTVTTVTVSEEESEETSPPAPLHEMERGEVAAAVGAPVSAPPTAANQGYEVLSGEPVDSLAALSWVDRYKLLKRDHAADALLAIIVPWRGFVLLREDAKDAFSYVNPRNPNKTRFVNTEHGMALFLPEADRTMENMAQYRRVLAYVDMDGDLQQFWQRHVVMNPQKPVSAPPGSPVRHNNPPAPQKDTAAEQERIERRVLNELEEMKKQVAFNAGRVQVEKLKTQGGKNRATSLIQQMEAVIADLRRRMG